jgi:ribosomal protein S7
MIKAAHDRRGRSMAEKLAAEILDASNGEGNALEKEGSCS